MMKHYADFDEFIDMNGMKGHSIYPLVFLYARSYVIKSEQLNFQSYHKIIKIKKIPPTLLPLPPLEQHPKAINNYLLNLFILFNNKYMNSSSKLCAQAKCHLSKINKNSRETKTTNVLTALRQTKVHLKD